MSPVVPRYEELSGVLRTHAQAHPQLTNRLAYAEYRTGIAMWVGVLPGLFLVPMITGGMLFFALSSWSLMWEYMTPMTLLMVVGGPVLSAVLLLGLPFFGGLARARWHWRLELPAGTPMYADFGPEWIGVGWPGSYRTVMLSQLQRVRQVGTTLVLSGGETPVLLPEELVPTHVAADLVSGAWRQRMGPPLSQQLHPVNPGQPQDAGVQPVAPGQLQPAGAIRTQAVADEGLADRLAAATRRSPAMRLVLILMVVMPIVAALVLYGKYGEFTLTTLLPVIAVFGCAGAALGYVIFYGTAARLRQMVPPGAPLTADFGPDWIGLRLGGYVQTAQMADIKRVDEISGALVLTMRGLRQGMLIPVELVPPQVGAESFGRCGG